jgi:hypothetical protein
LARISRGHAGGGGRKQCSIRKIDDEVILPPRPAGRSQYLRNGPVASDELMEGVEDLAVRGAATAAALDARGIC